MQSRARLAVVADRAPGTTRLSELRSDPPFVLRPTRAGWVAGLPDAWAGAGAGRAAVVALATAAAGPLGGDRLALDVDVGPGATLVLRGVSASVALPGPGRERSCTSVHIRVAAGATVAWLPGTLIATQRCHHEAVTSIELDEGARLFTREETVLGRHDETAGSLRQSLRVTVAGRPLLHQDLHVGADVAGWDGPAVTGGRKAVGSVLLVDPVRLPTAIGGVGGLPDDTAVFALDGPGVLVGSAAGEAHVLRQRLDTAVASLERWSETLTDPAPSIASDGPVPLDGCGVGSAGPATRGG